MGKKLLKSDIIFIQQLPVCRLATATEDCEPVVRPVWPVFDGVFVYIASDPDTPKLEHIEANPQVDGRNPLTSAGACYALYAPKWDLTRPVGSWNRVRILVQGNHTEYWLNGEKIVEYELGSAEWKKLVAESKFASMPDFAKRAKGRIALQDHGYRVSFRNIKIRPMPAR